MASGSYHFGTFILDPAERRLREGERVVDLNARYLDALILMVRDAGALVTKDRFMAEVWQGIPVTDEALTQCVRTLRRQLGDDAARPRFIATVPKHGYRFIAPVERIAPGRPADGPPAATALPEAGISGRPRQAVAWLTAAGTGGGAVAGLIGGLIYGFAAAAPGAGALSVLLVLLCLTLILAAVGAAGVSFGIAAARAAGGAGWLWPIVGGAGGGLVTGAVVKLIGGDAFDLLFGRAPGDVTGAPEGAILGAAAGLACWLTARGQAGLRSSLSMGGGIGVAAGLLIAALHGRLLAGSLVSLAGLFPASRLRLDRIGALVGESGFGPASATVTSAAESGLFVACVAGALTLARRGRRGP